MCIYNMIYMYIYTHMINNTLYIAILESGQLFYLFCGLNMAESSAGSNSNS